MEKLVSWTITKFTVFKYDVHKFIYKLDKISLYMATLFKISLGKQRE